MENRLQKPKDTTAKETTQKDTAQDTQQSVAPDASIKKSDSAVPLTPEQSGQVVLPAPRKINTSRDSDMHGRDGKHRSAPSDIKPQRSPQQQQNKRPSNAPRLMTESDLIDMQTNELS